MSASHFKIGDRVTAKQYPHCGRADVAGWVGTVMRIRRDGDVWVMFDAVLPKHLQSASSLVRMGSVELVKNQ